MTKTSKTRLIATGGARQFSRSRPLFSSAFTPQMVSAVTVLILAGLACRVKADVTVQQTVTGSGASEAKNNWDDGKTLKQTAYFTAGKQRVDMNGQVLLLDFVTRKATILYTAQKEFAEMSLVDWAKSQGMPNSKLRGEVFVVDTHEEKEIDGKAAHHYRYFMKFATSDPSVPQVAPMDPVAEVKGELWTIPYSTAGNSGDNSSSFSPQISLELRSWLLTDSNTEKSVLAKMSMIKGIPIEEDQLLAINVKDSTAKNTRKTLGGTATHIKSVVLSEEDITDSLFAVPDGYTKVTAEIP